GSGGIGVFPSWGGGVAAASRNLGEAHLSAADGVVTHKSNFAVSDHPGRSSKEASRHFLDVAFTPPHEEGNRRPKIFAPAIGLSAGAAHFTIRGLNHRTPIAPSTPAA